MAKSLSKRDNFGKIIFYTFGIAFFLILGVLLYATSTNTDLRSKAALEEKVYKRWEFEDMNLACIQVITPARNSKTGACQIFSTPCDVPVGWIADASCPTGSGVRE